MPYVRTLEMSGAEAFRNIIGGPAGEARLYTIVEMPGVEESHDSSMVGRINGVSFSLRDGSEPGLDIVRARVTSSTGTSRFGPVRMPLPRVDDTVTLTTAREHENPVNVAAGDADIYTWARTSKRGIHKSFALTLFPLVQSGK